jgi:hypothetical protein
VKAVRNYGKIWSKSYACESIAAAKREFTDKRVTVKPVKN